MDVVNLVVKKKLEFPSFKMSILEETAIVISRSLELPKERITCQVPSQFAD